MSTYEYRITHTLGNRFVMPMSVDAAGRDESEIKSDFQAFIASTREITPEHADGFRLEKRKVEDWETIE